MVGSGFAFKYRVQAADGASVFVFVEVCKTCCQQGRCKDDALYLLAERAILKPEKSEEKHGV
jgi:hypothetical protein